MGRPAGGADVKLREDRLVWQSVGDAIVILDLKSSKYFRLNGSAAMLWQLISAVSTPGELEEALVDRYGITAERAAQDVGQFVEALESKGFLDR